MWRVFCNSFLPKIPFINVQNVKTRGIFKKFSSISEKCHNLARVIFWATTPIHFIALPVVFAGWYLCTYQIIEKWDPIQPDWRDNNLSLCALNHALLSQDRRLDYRWHLWRRFLKRKSLPVMKKIKIKMELNI